MLDDIMRYEAGEMPLDEVPVFFTKLANFGYLEHLQGHYQRMFMNLVEEGLITPFKKENFNEEDYR